VHCFKTCVVSNGAIHTELLPQNSIYSKLFASQDIGLLSSLVEHPNAINTTRDEHVSVQEKGDSSDSAELEDVNLNLQKLESTRNMFLPRDVTGSEDQNWALLSRL